MVAGRPAPARALVVRGRTAALRPAGEERRVLRRARIDSLGRRPVRSRPGVGPAHAPARARVPVRTNYPLGGPQRLRGRARGALRAAGDQGDRRLGLAARRGRGRRGGRRSRGLPPLQHCAPRVDGARARAAALSRTVPLQLGCLAADPLRRGHRARRRWAAARAGRPDRVRRAADQLAARRPRPHRRGALPELRPARPRVDLVRAHLDRGRGNDARGAGDPDRAVSACRRVPRLHRPPAEPVHAPRQRHADARARRGDPPVPAFALPRARGLVRRPRRHARRGHGCRLPASASPGRPHRRDPLDRERLGQLPARRELPSRPRARRSCLHVVAAPSRRRRPLVPAPDAAAQPVDVPTVGRAVRHLAPRRGGAPTRSGRTTRQR